MRRLEPIMAAGGHLADHLADQLTEAPADMASSQTFGQGGGAPA